MAIVIVTDQSEADRWATAEHSDSPLKALSLNSLIDVERSDELLDPIIHILTSTLILSDGLIGKTNLNNAPVLPSEEAVSSPP